MQMTESFAASHRALARGKANELWKGLQVDNSIYINKHLGT